MPTLEICITTHAVERFQERVRPGLSFAAAADELAHLIGLGELREEPPPWCLTREDAGYLVIGDLVLPLAACAEDGVFYATTCLTRGSRSRFRRRPRCTE
jgi:hypothetical protein